MSEPMRPAGIRLMARSGARRPAGWLAVTVLVWLAATVAPAQEEKPASWRDIARTCGLSGGEIEHLAGHGAVLGRAEFRQVFQAYGKTKTPVFITTDSLLNGLHMLFEESFARFESAQAIRLRLVLADSRKKLPTIEKDLVCKSGLLAEARRRAAILLAVAHALLADHDGDEVLETLDDEITSYGQTLGLVMGCEGHAYLNPPDNAPKIADVFTAPAKGKHLEVGIGRPRALWVLYPWHGESILCRGAVLPYHEFLSSTRLTDGEWRARLASGHEPAPPAWLSPLKPPTLRGK